VKKTFKTQEHIQANNGAIAVDNSADGLESAPDFWLYFRRGVGNSPAARQMENLADAGNERARRNACA
jgi:hypothetical protein